MNKNLFIKLFTLLFILVNIANITPKNIAKANITIYHVPVELWHSENSGRLSMGNNALGTLAQVEETPSGSLITVEFVPMKFMNMNGHLLGMSVYSGLLFSGSLTPAKVISTYTDTDLNGKQSNFPALLQFHRTSQKEDKIGVKVSVDAMNQVLGGDASQNAILKFNWANANIVKSNKNTSTAPKTDSNQANVANQTRPVEIQKKPSPQTTNSNNLKPATEETTEAKITNQTSTTEENSSTKEAEKPKLKSLEDFFKADSKTTKTGLYNIDITAAYLNPLTGVTADGGTKNIEIGEGMSQGVISPVNADSTNLSDALKNQKAGGEKRWSKAQLQRTKDGKLYATVRIHLINWIKRSDEQGPFIKVLQENGEYQLVKSTESKIHIEEYKDSYADYTFEVPRENFSAMIQMFVEPMNRPVRFFVEVNPETIKNGSVDGMKSIEDKTSTAKGSKQTSSKNNFLYIGLVLIPIIGVLALAIARRK